MTRGTFLVHVQGVLAGLLASALVTSLMLLAVRMGWLNASPAVDKATVALAALTAVIVIAAFLKRRGIDS